MNAAHEDKTPRFEVDARGLSCPQPVLETKKKALTGRTSGEGRSGGHGLLPGGNVSRYRPKPGLAGHIGRRAADGGFRVLLSK
jgi:hypothetical protein